MIDGTSYNRMCADFAWEASEDEEAAEALFWAEDSLSAEEFAAFKAKQAAEKAARGLTDEETLLATNVLRGFSFADKKWFQLFIENFSEIVWNEVCCGPSASRASSLIHLRPRPPLTALCFLKLQRRSSGRWCPLTYGPRTASSTISSKAKDEDLSPSYTVRLVWARHSRQSALPSTPNALCMLCRLGISAHRPRI